MFDKLRSAIAHRKSAANPDLCADCGHPRERHAECQGLCADCMSHLGINKDLVVCAKFVSTPTPGWTR